MQCIAKDKGVPQDDKEAIKWWRLAAEQGNTEAKGLLDLLTNSNKTTITVQLMRQAVKARDNKDYKKALEILKPLAEQGEAKAQVYLGEMYFNGKGVPQDDKQAVKWWKLAAEQGVALAQFSLGLIYEHGQGVPQDYALAHMWFNLCGSSRDQDCEKNRMKVEKKMSPQQIAEAQRLARNWKPTKK